MGVSLPNTPLIRILFVSPFIRIHHIFHIFFDAADKISAKFPAKFLFHTVKVVDV
jgi:hypothetical protein